MEIVLSKNAGHIKHENNRIKGMNDRMVSERKLSKKSYRKYMFYVLCSITALEKLFENSRSHRKLMDKLSTKKGKVQYNF